MPTAIYSTRSRKFKRMIQKLEEIEFMTLPGQKPGKSFHAANIMLDRGEVEFIKKQLNLSLDIKGMINREREKLRKEFAYVHRPRNGIKLEASRQKRRDRMQKVLLDDPDPL
jgi:hypothetical protein